MEVAYQNLLQANGLPPDQKIGNQPPGNSQTDTPVDKEQAPVLPPDQGGMPHAEKYTGQVRNDSGKPEDDGEPKKPGFGKAGPALTMTGHDPRPDTDYDPEQLKMGIKIEMEHTKDNVISEKIAKDHLDEDPQYYTHLVTMEDKYKKGRL